MTDKPHGIGGPGAAVVAGLSPYKTPLQYFYELRGELPASPEETEAMEWGTILEEPIAKKYATLTGRTIRRQPPKLSPAHPFMRASIDYQVVNDPRGPGILECKNFGYWTGKSIKSLTDVPDHVYLQGQHYLAVYGYAWCSFALLIGGQHFVWFDVERHEAVIAKLIDLETAFWERVQRNDPPPIDGSAQTAEILKQLYPQDSGAIVTIEDHFVHGGLGGIVAEALAEERPTPIAFVGMRDRYGTSGTAEEVLQYLEWKSKEKEAEAAKLAEENYLKDRLKEATKALIPGFGEITWKTAAPSRKEVLDVERFRADQPDLYKKYLRVETKASGRRFLVKPDKALVPQEDV